LYEFLQYSDEANTIVCATRYDGTTKIIELDMDDWVDVVAGNPTPFTPYIPTLPELAATKVAQLTAAYQTAIQQPVTYMGTTFQADDASRASITEAVAPDPLPDGYEWLDANNVFVPMTSAQLQSLAAVMRKQVQVAFVKLQERKAAVRAATTVAQIGAVVW